MKASSRSWAIPVKALQPLSTASASISACFLFAASVLGRAAFFAFGAIKHNKMRCGTEEDQAKKTSVAMAPQNERAKLAMP